LPHKKQNPVIELRERLERSELIAAMQG